MTKPSGSDAIVIPPAHETAFTWRAPREHPLRSSPCSYGSSAGGFAMQQRATVGSSVVIKGELLAQEDVVIAGRVEGMIHVAGHLVVVEAGAHVAGDIAAATIIVSGGVHGSLLAEERITVQAGADLQGDIAAPRVAVADGAVVNGRIETVTASSRRKLKVAS